MAKLNWQEYYKKFKREFKQCHIERLLDSNGLDGKRIEYGLEKMKINRRFEM